MAVPSTPFELWTEAVLADAEKAIADGRHTFLIWCFYCRAAYIGNVWGGSVTGRCVCGSGIMASSDPAPDSGGSFRYVDPG